MGEIKKKFKSVDEALDWIEQDFFRPKLKEFETAILVDVPFRIGDIDVETVDQALEVNRELFEQWCEEVRSTIRAEFAAEEDPTKGTESSARASEGGPDA